MKSTGIVRKMDDLGRVVVPKETRRILKIEEGDSLEFFVDGNKIILQKYESKNACVFCGTCEDKPKTFLGRTFCSKCYEMIRQGVKVYS